MVEQPADRSVTPSRDERSRSRSPPRAASAAEQEASRLLNETTAKLQEHKISHREAAKAFSNLVSSLQPGKLRCSALLNRAHCYVGMGNFTAALEDVNHIIEDSPPGLDVKRWHKVWMSRAGIHRKLAQAQGNDPALYAKAQADYAHVVAHSKGGQDDRYASKAQHCLDMLPKELPPPTRPLELLVEQPPELPAAQPLELSAELAGGQPVVQTEDADMLNRVEAREPAASTAHQALAGLWFEAPNPVPDVPISPARADTSTRPKRDVLSKLLTDDSHLEQDELEPPPPPPQQQQQQAPPQEQQPPLQQPEQQQPQQQDWQKQDPFLHSPARRDDQTCRHGIDAAYVTPRNRPESATRMASPATGGGPSSPRAAGSAQATPQRPAEDVACFAALARKSLEALGRDVGASGRCLFVEGAVQERRQLLEGVLPAAPSTGAVASSLRRLAERTFDIRSPGAAPPEVVVLRCEPAASAEVPDAKLVEMSECSCRLRGHCKHVAAALWAVDAEKVAGVSSGGRALNTTPRMQQELAAAPASATATAVLARFGDPAAEFRCVEWQKRLAKKTVDELKGLLRLNNQLLSGSKGEIIQRVAEGAVYGALPQCPQCHGHLHADGAGLGGQPSYRCRRTNRDKEPCGYEVAADDVVRRPFMGLDQL